MSMFAVPWLLWPRRGDHPCRLFAIEHRRILQTPEERVLLHRAPRLEVPMAKGLEIDELSVADHGADDARDISRVDVPL